MSAIPDANEKDARTNAALTSYNASIYNSAVPAHARWMRLVVAVKDRGAGISPAKQKLMFQSVAQVQIRQIRSSPNSLTDTGWKHVHEASFSISS